MSRLVILLFLCIATIYKPGYCETRTSRDVEHRGLPEFLSELDLSSLEATKEDVEALKKTVKRLAPEKNGEYQVYQVYFGNEDLLKEWLKGAGVTGQPGVDYPALTTIPATSFSCRGLRGGYYADLETNCQVFHICDNGRKISFLCPNGTIFQQSQLICDWWFKVDCSKSTELYEQSAEQLAEQEKKRIETKKIKSEFHRTVEQDNANYYASHNRDYDGSQNGRTNPYSQSAKQNEIQEKQEKSKSEQHFGSNNVIDNARDSNRYYQGNNVNGFQSNEKTNRLPEYLNQSPKQRQYQDSRSGDYHTTNRPKNQLLNTQDSKFNYEHKNKIQDNYQDYQSNVQNYYRPNQNLQHHEKSGSRNSKSQNNLINSNQSQKPTPTYTETTTFRTTTTSPPREFQQFAESAAFVSNRGNRFNSKSEDNKQSYYHSYDNRGTTIDNRYRETTTLTPERNQKGDKSFTFAPVYKHRTTTAPSYESTLQYTPTTETSSFYTTSFYKQTNNPGSVYPTTNIATSSSIQAYPTTEFYGRYNNQQAPIQVGSVPPPAERNYQGNDNKRDIDRDTDTISFATTRPYVNTESYRYNTTSTSNQNTYRSSTSSLKDNRSQINRNSNTRAIYQKESNIANGNIKNTTKIPSYTSQGSGQNSISSTEKSWRSTTEYQQDDSMNKNLSPYDTSFTYKQGKVLSTLGPYVPFTKNYVYSSMTTSTLKPPNYTTTVPNYNSISADYRTTTNNPVSKGKSLFPVTSRTKDRATYLPEVNTKRSMTLENRPYAEREHVLSMLHSLQGLESNANSLSEAAKRGGGSGRDIPLASGPSTLHSLALYFATANDSFDSNGTTDTTVSSEQQQETREKLSTSHNTSVDLPTSILTQHTISSYAELFNLNNALEGNSTITEFQSEADDDENDDLDIEQSEGPLNGAKRSNNTNLRELAQVFTHALSAYLQDPETFKKILTEIRPTEPSAITSDNSYSETTTSYPPTTAEEYSSVTKEKDEVLDFSDDIDSSRRRKPIFSTTLQPPTTTDRTYSTYYTTPYDEYYSTSFSQTRRPDYYPSTTILPPTFASDSSRDFIESSTQPASNTFAFEVNHAFGITNDIRNYDAGTTDSTDFSQLYDNYFPLYDDGNQNKIGRSRSNKTIQPYGKNVKPFDATPITNYIASSTVPSHQKSEKSQSWNRGSIGNKPITQELMPPFYQSSGNVKGFEVSNSVIPSHTATRSTTPLPEKIIYDSASTTVHPFRIQYYETTTLPESRKTTPESLVTARSSYVKFRNNYNRIEGTGKSARDSQTTTQATTTQNAFNTLDSVTVTDANSVNSYTAAAPFITKNSSNISSMRNSKLLNNDHWTSSPMVTQLWETTVFVDPRHINHGLESNNYDSYPSSTTENSVTDELEFLAVASTTAQPILSTDYPDETTETQSTVNTVTSSPWKWTPNDNDAPVTFTLFPSTYSTENTATPTPLITTHSSITTTLTSSVTSTKPASTLLPYTITTDNLNATENEVIRAQEIFGKLNQSSSSMLMRIMKQADNNESVRQLVLLLISYCKAPKNKTVEEEREQLLETLLRMPVNEFTSGESREIVAGINKLTPSIGKVRSVVSSSSTRPPRASSVRPTSSEPSITTFRSRTGRKFRTTTERANSLARRSDQTNLIDIHTGNALSDGKTSESDNRALELLRSLYTIAAKWG